MKCPKCFKLLPLLKLTAPSGDAVVCSYCGHTVSSDKIAWSDGLFHFRIVADVVKMNIAPRVLLDKQTTKKLDIKNILSRAKIIIKKEPNLMAICQEFMIEDSDIRFELLTEEQDKK